MLIGKKYDLKTNNCCHLSSYLMHYWYGINVEKKVGENLKDFEKRHNLTTAKQVVEKLLNLGVIEKVDKIKDCHFIRIQNLIIPHYCGKIYYYNKEGTLMQSTSEKIKSKYLYRW